MLTRWEPPTEVRPGWRHAVSVWMTRDSLVTHLDETGLGKVAFYPPPNPDGLLRFILLLGAPDGAELTVRNAVEVGTLELPGGGLIGVILDHQPLEPSTAAKIQEIRTQMLQAVTRHGAHRTSAFAWGRLADDAVLLLDPGAVEPDGPTPGDTGRCGAPVRITYVRRVDPAS